jgi:hypothetical protein
MKDRSVSGPSVLSADEDQILEFGTLQSESLVGCGANEDSGKDLDHGLPPLDFGQVGV